MPTKQQIDQELFDELLDDSLNFLRLGASERKKVLVKIAELEAELKKLVEVQDFSFYSRAELNKVIAAANATISQYYTEASTSVDKAAIAQYAATATAASLEIALGIEGIRAPKSSYYKSLNSNILIDGAQTKDWWEAQNAKTQLAFKRQLQLGLAQGETNQQLIYRIVGKLGSPGIMDIARKDAASLVQTSVQAVANDARRNTFDENDDIIKGMRQVSTLDSHTSPTCVAYSGAAWNLKREPIEGNTLPFGTGCPRHFNCRSTEVPITKTFRELGIDIDEPKGTTRASDEGQISIDTSFDSFLSRKSKAYADEMLGKGRADLWRAKKITLKDLVDGQGNERTLEQLNALVKKRQAR